MSLGAFAYIRIPFFYKEPNDMMSRRFNWMLLLFLCPVLTFGQGNLNVITQEGESNLEPGAQFYTGKSAATALEDFIPQNAMRKCVISPNALRIAALQGKNVLIFDALTGDQVGSIPLGSQGTDVFWSTDDLLSALSLSENGESILVSICSASSLKVGNSVVLSTNDLWLSAGNYSGGSKLFFEGGMRQQPNLYSLEVATGEVKLEIENPGNVSRWCSGAAGAGVYAMHDKGEIWQISKRDGNSYSAMVDLEATEYFEFIGSGKGRVLFYSDLSKNGMAVSELDETPADLPTTMSGINSKSNRIAAVGYNGAGVDGFRLKGLQPDYFFADDNNTSAWLSAKRYFAPKYVFCEDMNSAAMRYVFRVTSATESGTYYLFNGATGKFSKLGTAGSIKAADEDMNAYAVTELELNDAYKAQALSLVPSDIQDLNAPMILMLNADAMHRFDFSYNPTAQMLASRGFRVMLLNVEGGFDLTVNEEWIKVNGDPVAPTKSDIITQAIKNAVKMGQMIGIFVDGEAALLANRADIQAMLPACDAYAAIGNYLQLNQASPRTVEYCVPRAPFSNLSESDRAFSTPVKTGSLPTFLGLIGVSTDVEINLKSGDLTLPDNRHTYRFFKRNANEDEWMSEVVKYFQKSLKYYVKS
jgi:hypothetical protein